MTEQLEGQMTMFDLVSPSGKTYQERSAATKALISKPSCKHSATSWKTDYIFLDLRNGTMPDVWQEMDGALHGGSTMLNTGPAPLREESASTLSQILEANVPEKYYLSAKACMGIMRRAEKRGKELPPMLKEALEEVVLLDRIIYKMWGNGIALPCAVDVIGRIANELRSGRK